MRRSRNPSQRTQRGQATVELALCIPMLVILLLLLVQVGMVMSDEILVTHAAREAARAAAVDPSPGAAAAAAAASSSRLDPAELHTHVGLRPGADGMVHVTVQYQATVTFPLTGRVLFHPQLQADAAMRVEQ